VAAEHIPVARGCHWDAGGYSVNLIALATSNVTKSEIREVGIRNSLATLSL